MPFQLSPGINTSEVDLTTVVPAVSSTTGAIAGVFTWGPSNVATLVTSEVDLVNRFGAPKVGFNPETFFTAADFLAYGNSLYVVRVTDGVKATPDANSAYDTSITAKYEGSFGNNLSVVIVGPTGNTSVLSANTKVYADRLRTPSTGFVNVLVMNRTTGVALEVYEAVSAANTSAKTEDGATNYLVEVINQKSAYITMTDAAATAVVSGGANIAVEEGLTAGTDGSNESTIAIASVQAGYDLFVSPEDIDISLVLAGKARGTNGVQIANYISDNIIDARKDCMLFVSPESTSVVSNVGNELTALKRFSSNLRKSSYIVLDSSYKYRYDRYNDRYIYTPLNGDIAGLCVRTDSVRDPWFSPAGSNRGAIKNIIKLSYNPKKADRDELYKADINPVITQPGQGTILFGDKTHLGRTSAFDRINVRRLFIVLEKAISRAAKSTLFEFNDEFTRAQFKNLVEPFLRDVQGRRGIYDFRVVCDDTNNTAEVIDRNEFVGDIYVKPARAINFIQLNFVAVRTGVEFEEIIGQR